MFWHHVANRHARGWVVTRTGIPVIQWDGTADHAEQILLDLADMGVDDVWYDTDADTLTSAPFVSVGPGRFLGVVGTHAFESGDPLS